MNRNARPSAIKQHVTNRVIEQFHHPRGIYGRIAGRIMSTRDGNVSRNKWIAQVLQPPSGAKILEIGHGPGIAIESLWPNLDGGHITGLEISELMHHSATKRNKAGIAAGRVDLRVGDSANPPADLNGFDLIYGVNASMFWTDPGAAVVELASRLTPGGELVFAFMPPPNTTEDAETIAAQIADLFTSAGLTDISLQEMDHQPKAIATRGKRPRQ
jgi:SAM-dependent methyltransferase